MKFNGAYLHFFFLEYVEKYVHITKKRWISCIIYIILNSPAQQKKKKIIHFQMHGLLLPRIICLFMNLQLDSYRNIFNHIFHINFVYKVLHAHIPYLCIWYIQILINPTICMLMFQQTHLVIVFVYNVWNTMVTLLRIYDISWYPQK